MWSVIKKLRSNFTSNIKPEEFILVCGPRTGSNLLISLIQGHTDVRVAYELFNFAGEQDENILKILRNPYQHMIDFFSESHKKKKKVSGFKLIYGQGNINQVREFLSLDLNTIPEKRRELYKHRIKFIKENFNLEDIERSFKKVSDYISDNEKVNIIHLKRKNLLEVLYSYKIASITDSWSSKYPSGVAPPDKIHISFDECREYFHLRRSEEKQYDEMFKDHRKIELYYEDLLRNREETMRNVFDFFKLSPVETRPGFEKQIKKPLNEALENYDDLKLKFKGSEWEHFFQY